MDQTDIDRLMCFIKGVLRLREAELAGEGVLLTAEEVRGLTDGLRTMTDGVLKSAEGT